MVKTIKALSSPYAALNHAIKIKKRWIKGEDIIKKDLGCAFRYVEFVVKKRWIEGEEVIKRDCFYAYKYANDIIKGRWLEGEKAIINHCSYWAIRYAEDVIKSRWTELEEYFLNKKNKSSRFVYDYCTTFNFRWIEAEKYLTDGDTIRYCEYFKIPLPKDRYTKELSKIISGDSKYFKKIKKKKEELKEILEYLVDAKEVDDNDTVKKLLIGLKSCW